MKLVQLDVCYLTFWTSVWQIAFAVITRTSCASHATAAHMLMAAAHVSLLNQAADLVSVIPVVFSTWHGSKACAKRTGAAASVSRRRCERLVQAGRGMQASRCDTRAASHVFEHMRTHASTLRKLRDSAVLKTRATCARFIILAVGIRMCPRARAHPVCIFTTICVGYCMVV